ncbi:3-hydroxyisobutyryl-CoA hydrolase, mitochondrial-like isoform X1 [Diorhabda sublineata]|uniref:3-hydroxyisobutyryl-CoA hydrolase, mitochondrial-like isoform X1 n=2 Tax=Diorhabda sublineata TaxID=1163346 RepID=UPI0024E07F17|nr:3-hydroxyisobutyryl-CoA hydrolase, mitochondrial-like isoform X1 [Diorhabda sublineata]
MNIAFQHTTRLITRHVKRKLLRKYSTESLIVTKEVERAGLIILNRPHVLNALNEIMINETIELLSKWETKKEFVVIKGIESRAFCTGGDILECLKAIERTKNINILYEYIKKLNEILYLLFTYKIPIISIIDGIAFGAGASMAVFSKHPIVTENTLLSMPEVKFGFHPNAGGSYFLNKLDIPLRNFLALTGHVLKGADLIHIGYSKNFCYSKNIKKMEEDILNCSVTNDQHFNIEKYCEKTIPESYVATLMDKINRCFNEETVEDIISKLKDDNSLWSKETRRLLETYSPTSLKVILRQMQITRNMNLRDCLTLESNLSPNFYRFTDVLEGTKAIIVDKTYKPMWNPSKLSDVTEELIQNHFKSNNDKSHKEMLDRRDTLQNDSNNK